MPQDFVISWNPPMKERQKKGWIDLITVQTTHRAKKKCMTWQRDYANSTSHLTQGWTWDLGNDNNLDKFGEYSRVFPR